MGASRRRNAATRSRSGLPAVLHFIDGQRLWQQRYPTSVRCSRRRTARPSGIEAAPLFLRQRFPFFERARPIKAKQFFRLLRFSAIRPYWFARSAKTVIWGGEGKKSARFFLGRRRRSNACLSVPRRLQLPPRFYFSQNHLIAPSELVFSFAHNCKWKSQIKSIRSVFKCIYSLISC